MNHATRFTKLTLLLIVAGAFALAGCGGDDAYSISAEDQARIDTLAGDLATAKTQAEADLKEAQDEIDSLTAQIGMEADGDMAATGLYKDLADARAAAATAQTTIGELTATIGMMPGDDGMGGSGLQADLAKYKGMVDDLEMQIGMMDDPTTEADESSGLRGQLAMYQAKAADLQDTLGMMADGDTAATGLYKELADTQAKVTELEGMIGAAPGDDGMGGSGLEADLAKYKGMVDDLEMKIGMMATDDMPATGLYKDLADAMAEAKTYKDMVGMEAEGDNPATGLRKMIADLEADRDMYKRQLAEALGEKDTDEAMDASAEAEALLAVLVDGTLNADNAVSGLGAPHGSNLRVGVSSDGMLTVRVADDDAYSMSDTVPDVMIEDWRGAMLTRENSDGTMDTVAVYSNIGDDGADSLFDTILSNQPTPTTPRTYQINAPAGAAAANLIDWSEVTRPDAETMLGGTPTTPTLTFMGSALGIPGIFSCDGAAGDVSGCTAPTRYSDDSVATGTDTGIAAGTWVFIPDEGVSLYTDDTTYLTLGWWLDKDVAGSPDDFAQFALANGLGATRAEVSTAGDALTGSATYKGAAVGNYAIASTTADSYEGGDFTAMATMTANFDADSDAAVAGNDREGIALSGMIDNFMTGGTARSDWSVKLMADADMDATNGLQPVDDLGSGLAPDSTSGALVLTTEWSTGAAAKGMGSWTPTFHDGRTAGTNITDVADNTALPMAVTGTFDANIGTSARLQGAFGAMKED